MLFITYEAAPPIKGVDIDGVGVILLIDFEA